MFLPLRLLALELKRSNCWRQYRHYEKTLIKVERNILRLKFLENCKRAEVIPKFLKFRIPNNGCFDEKNVHEFQRKLLKKELIEAKNNQRELEENLDGKRRILREQAPRNCLPSIILYTRNTRIEARRKQSRNHNKKLTTLSEEQERPLFNVKNTVVLCDLQTAPPAYVMETLALGPKNAILDKFDPKDVLAEVDGLLNHCKNKKISDEIITDINVKTLNYIKKCKQMKTSRHITMTKKYLKENNLLAVPFDKGVGICIMKKATYHEKLNKIINLPQFEKLHNSRKNAKHPVLREEDRVKNILTSLLRERKIDEGLYDSMVPRGSQPARLYGLAKVHKKDIPVRPVLSIPGSAYHKVAVRVAKWLSVVPDCKINSSTKTVCDKLKSVTLEEDEIMISFDVSSLYTNVPVMEAILVCTDKLYNMPVDQRPPIDRETFITLAKVASCEVVLSTHDGFYKQVDGLAMGSPPAPHLANGWLSQFENSIKDDAKIYDRYMDDILREIKRSRVEQKLKEINNLHKNLDFTFETEVEQRLSFLDMLIVHDMETGDLSSTWYCKPTDTGLILNYHALAPKRYKRSVVSGFVHRIYRACSSWKHVHDSLEKAKHILEKNQYPPAFYDPIIKQTLDAILRTADQPTQKIAKSQSGNVFLFIQYRGKCTEDYARALHKLEAPCTIVMTLRKLKTALPSLKPPVEKMIKSGLVYRLTCPRCSACYVGQTSRHLKSRFKEHLQRAGPMKTHLSKCNTTLTEQNVDILQTTSHGEYYLLTLEALHIRELKPQINTKDEFRSRELMIKL